MKSRPGTYDHRVLVDGVWPRGLSKDMAKIDEWLTNVAPTSGLRKRFSHGPCKWDQVKSHYFQQLDEHADVIANLLGKAKRGA